MPRSPLYRMVASRPNCCSTLYQRAVWNACTPPVQAFTSRGEESSLMHIIDFHSSRTRVWRHLLRQWPCGDPQQQIWNTDCGPTGHFSRPLASTVGLLRVEFYRARVVATF